MSALSNYTEAAVINCFLRNTAATAVSTPYVALYTSAPNDDNSGTECDYPAYTRMLSAWSAPGTDGVTKNTAAITFPANDDLNPIVVTHLAVFDAATNGNMLFHGPLAAPKTLNNTDILTFAIDALAITLA